MNPFALVRPLGLGLLATLGTGCSGETIPNTTNLFPTPTGVIAPEAPTAPQTPATAVTHAAPSEPATAKVEPVDLATVVEPAGDAEKTAEATLVPVKWDAFRDRLAHPPKGTKYSIVDAWATYCPPCKENFPHLVELHHKYGDQGLNVVSLSLDDPLETKDVEAARAFLLEKKAVFANYLMNEDIAEGYNHLKINAIPAVFVYGPDGQEIKRFTLDDVDNQFTYEQVDAYIQDLFQGQPSAAGSSE